MRKQTQQKNVEGLEWGSVERKAAKELIEKTFDKLKTTTASLEGKTDKFFPHGIELIFLKLKFSSVEFELKVAGAAGVKELLSGNQTISWEQNPSE